ncbi:MAG: NAD(P)H-binding protein [Saprospiraceae bacterium]
MSDQSTIRNSNKKALVFGASGLVGSQVVSFLSDHAAYSRVDAFYRSGDETEFEKLHKHVVEFEDMSSWADQVTGKDLYMCMGTTMKKAGSKKVFHHIEFDYITQIASIAAENGVNQFIIVSASSADKNSLFFYNQVKGLIENKIKRMDFWAIHILRPSILLGQREETRTLESFAAGAGLALKAIGPKLFSGVTPIEAQKVAFCMVKVAQETRSGVFYYPSSVIAKLGKMN